MNYYWENCVGKIASVIYSVPVLAQQNSVDQNISVMAKPLKLPATGTIARLAFLFL